MNRHYRFKTLTMVLSVLVFLSACAARQAYNRGQSAELQRDYETAMEQFRVALESDPSNIQYRLKYEQARYAAAFEHFENGRRALDRQDFDAARMEFTRAIEIDPTHALAKQELERVNQVISSRSANQPAPPLNYLELRENARTNPSVAAQLEPTIAGPISQFQMNQNSRMIFETLAELAGLNIIFDPDFRGTQIEIDLSNLDIYEALDILSLQTRSFWKPINRNTIVISPDNTTKRREYEEHVLKTIYLANSVTSTEITEAITAIRTLLNMRFVAQVSAMNAIILRDTPDRIAIAEKIIEDIDKSKPEVLVDAVVLEVDRNNLRELGILPPGQTSLIYGTPGVPNSNVVNLRDLPNINSGSFSITIPDTVANFLATHSTSDLIQNPRIRATDGKLAQIRIGQKVPIPSGSFQPAFVGATGTPVVQFQYIDVGVNLDITPRVLLNREISMVVNVQVSAVAGESNVGGAILPILSNRQVQHEIRLNEGETNILGGIISNAELTTITGVPGLNRIPILKYFFGSERARRDDTEIIIMLTPHVIRMPSLSENNLRGLRIGFETRERITGGDALAPAQPSPAPPPAEPAAAPTPAPPPGGASLPANRGTGASLAFSAPTVTLTASGPSTVNIGVSGNAIFGADLTLSFDPTSVKIREIHEGGLLSQDGQIIAVIQKIEPETGTARISLERPPGTQAISGTGTLLTMTLERGTMKGDSILRVTDFKVRDAEQRSQAGRPAEIRISVP